MDPRLCRSPGGIALDVLSSEKNGRLGEKKNSLNGPVLEKASPGAHSQRRQDAKAVDFARQVRPILAKKCFACHGPDEKHRQADLRLDTQEGALADLGGYQAIVPGKPDESSLLERVTSKDDDLRMPPAEGGAKRLADEEVSLIRQWIAQGAKWGRHWSFEPIKQPPLPTVNNKKWPREKLDYFVLARLEREGLTPAPQADRVRLLRRVTFDLTGLPPTEKEIFTLLGDTRPDAYERAVDRLLDSPAYGHRWASMWLDLARYADTRGYEKDRGRTIWRYRDWVIQALNQDMPYDKFTIEQLAGDLLKNPTNDQILATAFHRNTMTNDEGGTDNEEFRVAAVKDRVDTTMQVWMGLTMGCAKCHTHKYDPISHEEYYKFYAFFNQSADADRSDEAPVVAMPTEQQQQLKSNLQTEIASAQEEILRVAQTNRQQYRDWERAFAEDLDWSLPHLQGSSATGTMLTHGEQGMLRATGEKPQQTTYTVDVATDLKNISAIRLQVFPDKKTGHAGRAQDGNFVLTKFSAYVVRPNGTKRKVTLSSARADYEQSGYPIKDALALGPNNGGWAVSGATESPHEAIFYLKMKIPGGQGSKLHFVLEQNFDRLDDSYTIAQFRIMLSSQEKPRSAATLPVELRKALASEPSQRTQPQQRQLMLHFAEQLPAAKKLFQRIAQLRENINKIKVPSIPIMRDLPQDKQRSTHVHITGNFLNPGKRVPAEVPAAFHAWNSRFPKNRLGLAHWLVDKNNTLTARVAVNRYWAQMFGRGLVETEEDFGTQGTLPSHPRLLDYLASEFMRDWSMKQLCRRIVLSATYRQSARITPQAIARDKFNRLLARGPRTRLTAEMVRDGTLAVAGLLSDKMYGPPVMPIQPEGIWQTVYSGASWQTATGEDRYRRGIYTYLKRTSPYPSMTIFDAPSRELCTMRRIATNTPLQALVTLNDPVYIEAAQSLARRMVIQGGTTPRQRAAFGLRQALQRKAHDKEIDLLVNLYQRRLAYYRQHPKAAEAMATDPLGPLPSGQSAAELAAWTTVCNVILNLDEFLTKG